MGKFKTLIIIVIAVGSFLSFTNKSGAIMSISWNSPAPSQEFEVGDYLSVSGQHYYNWCSNGTPSAGISMWITGENVPAQNPNSCANGGAGYVGPGGVVPPGLGYRIPLIQQLCDLDPNAPPSSCPNPTFYSNPDCPVEITWCGEFTVHFSAGIAVMGNETCDGGTCHTPIMYCGKTGVSYGSDFQFNPPHEGVFLCGPQGCGQPHVICNPANGGSWKRTFYIPCEAENTDPSCSISMSTASVSHTSSTPLTATATVSDADGDALTVDWNYNGIECGKVDQSSDAISAPASGETSGTAQTGITYSKHVAGCTGQVKATVTDGNGGSATCTTDYAITNQPVSVVSVTPSSGVSGTETDSDNGPACTGDKNPTEYTVTYRDPDGVDDISFAALWVDDVSPNVQNIQNSISGHVSQGSTVHIYAQKVATGSCSSVSAVMQLLVDDMPVRSWTNVNNYDLFRADFSERINPSRMKIKMAYDCCDGTNCANGALDLRVDKVVVEGDIIEAESASRFTCGSPDEQGETLFCDGDTLTLPSRSTWANGWRYSGLEYQSALSATCSGLLGTSCSKNFTWSATTGGLVAPDATQTNKLCAPGSGYSYLSNCSGSPAGFTVTNVAENATDLAVTWKVWYYNDIGTNLNLYGNVNDGAGSATGWQDKGDWTLDLVPPTTQVLGINVVAADRVKVNWNVSDASGVTRVMGAAEAVGDGMLMSPIDKLSPAPAVYGYDVTADPLSWTLWNYAYPGVATAQTGAETIDIQDNEGGDLKFYVAAEDIACNVGESTCGTSDCTVSSGIAWLITKGGHVYTSGGSNVDVKELTGAEGITPEAEIWESPYYFVKNIISLSTEFSSTNTSVGTLSDVHITDVSGYRAFNYEDQNNREWYSRLQESLEKKRSRAGSEIVYSEVSGANIPAGQQLSQVFGGACNGVDFPCAVQVNGDLSIGSGFVCDRETAILVSGTLTIQPDITRDDTKALNGCIFVVQGNVTIGAGGYKSGGSAYPKYDKLEAFVISDASVIASDVDSGQDVRDGLKVHGSLLGFGGTRSFVFDRSLKLKDNNTYPTIVMHFDNRYLDIAQDFFVADSYGYVQDVGLKLY